MLSSLLHSPRVNITPQYILFFLCFLVLVMVLVRFCAIPKGSHQRRQSQDLSPMLPYPLPFFGHTVSFIMNSEKLINHGREFFGNTRNIFSIVILGKSFHILTNPRHVAIVHSKPTTFEFTGILKDALIALGASKEAARVLWSPKSVKDVLRKGVIPSSHDLQIRQTSGKDLKTLSHYICGFLKERTSPEAITLAHNTQSGVESLSIMEWARENIIFAMQDAYFGPQLHKIDPTLPRAMIEFSDLAWQAWYQVPWFLRRKQLSLCKRMLSSYQRYLDLPTNERKATAWFTGAFEKSFQEVLTNHTDKAALMMFFHWGIGMNPADATGWLVAHITFDTSLTEIIREETAPAFKDNGSLDTFYLATSCPTLLSVWYEVLRLYTSVTTMRNVTEETNIGDIHFDKGDKLMFSARQLALDETVFSKNAAEFDAMRFLKNPELQYSESLRPFGGGKTICPGRTLAMHVAMALVAILLRRYNITPAFPQEFPQPFEGDPSIGVMRTKDGLYMHLEKRT
ncbi:cytochrome P450 [Massariosphaeria phaeospora]|uniref:Cytochrome P450 n=1 Tax=Massariosphaeria phaeospora TaxID=100035 RepID=A0A7C8IRU1_9PLEO|nr:cytochrome P450 [Massariosphaeria phaeospora]